MNWSEEFKKNPSGQMEESMDQIGEQLKELEGKDIIVKSKTFGKNVLGRASYILLPAGLVLVNYSYQGKRMRKEVPIKEFLEWQKEKADEIEIDPEKKEEIEQMRKKVEEMRGKDVVVKSKTFGMILGKISDISQDGFVLVKYSKNGNKRQNKVYVREFLEWQKEKPDNEPENPSIESLRYRNMERFLEISDTDGISSFAESPDGALISYITEDRSKLKVFDRTTGSIKVLYTAGRKSDNDMLINLGMKEIKTYSFGGEFAIGYIRKGKFIIQGLSHYNRAESIIAEIKADLVSYDSYFISKSKKNLITQHRANEISCNNIENGEVKKIDLSFYTQKMVDSENGSLGMAIGPREITIFNKDTMSALEQRFKTDISSASFLGDDSFVLAQDKKLVYYDIGYTLEVVKEQNIGFSPKEIILSIDKKYLFCHSYELGVGVYSIIEIETGKVVTKINGEQIYQNLKGEIVVLNKDGEIEQYHLNDKPKKSEDRTHRILVDSEAIVPNKDKYSLFTSKKFETRKGMFWDYYENTISRQLKNNGNFKWAEQRLYLEIPLNELKNVKEIIVDICSKEKIPIQFKFVDISRTDKEILKDHTRFVLNFKNIEDTKEFYNFLSQNILYKKIIPDRVHDYHGYRLDNKTTYASGYVEYRKDDLGSLDEWKKKFTKNSDGSYSSKIPNVETGKPTILSAEEYQNIVNGKDPSLVSQKKWEETSS